MTPPYNGADILNYCGAMTGTVQSGTGDPPADFAVGFAEMPKRQIACTLIHGSLV